MDSVKLNEIIWKVVAAIPKGSVATYGQVAKLAGAANHARYVGTVLKQLPQDSSLPWHRVINAKGEISFLSNSAPFLKQKALLEAEGIVFSQFNKVSLARFAWQP